MNLRASRGNNVVRSIAGAPACPFGPFAVWAILFFAILPGGCGPPRALSFTAFGEMIDRARCPMAEHRHPGISMHKLPVGGGFVGFLFAAGSALIFVLGFPALWYFVLFAALLGLGIAVLLGMVHERRSDRDRPLSILTAPAKPTRARPNRDQPRLLCSLPRFNPAR